MWRSRLVVVALWAMTVALCALNLALFRGRVLTPLPVDPPTYAAEVLFILLPLVFGSVGALIAMRRRDNPIGWILSAGVLGVACYAFAAGYAQSGLVFAPGALPGALVAGWLTNWLWTVGPLSISLTLQLFPDGRVVNRRWRRAVWITIFGFTLAAVAAAVAPGPLNNIETINNPFGWDALAGVANVLFLYAGLFELVAFGLAFASLAVRFRRGRGIERLQLKWLAYAGTLLPVVALANLGVPILGSWGLLPVWSAIYAIPIAIGIAVLRHRLYDIDLIIRRTLVYGVLTAGLGVVYWTAIFVFQRAVQPFTAGSDFAIVASTLAVAAVFQPLRRSIQLVVDRRFYRQRYDAARTLESFSVRLRDEVDLDALGSELLAAVSASIQPQRASLWLRPVEPKR